MNIARLVFIAMLIALMGWAMVSFVWEIKCVIQARPAPLAVSWTNLIVTLFALFVVLRYAIRSIFQ
jgi:hypothetical protein